MADAPGPAAATVGAILADVRRRFRAAGLATADLDARLLVAAAAGLAPDRLVLDGGPDGLDAYRAIIGTIESVIERDGALVVEVGYDQAAAIGELAIRSGLEVEAIRQDLGGVERAVTMRRGRGKMGLGKPGRSG